MEFDADRDAVIASLMEFENDFWPMLDSVERVRQYMEDQGWEPEGAESVAVEWFKMLAGMVVAAG